MSIVIGQFDKRSDTSAHVEGKEFRERTNGGMAIFFFALFMSTCITAYGIWELVRFVIDR